MAKINFKNGRIEDYTIVLSTRDYRHLGQLTGIKSENIQNSNHLSSANEMSFSLYKYDLLKENNVLSDEEYKKYQIARTILWNQIVDFRLIWVKELNEYYEIKVSIDDAQETYKTITATSLCEAELSQYNIDSLEVNTESDIERDDYVVTTFYNKEDINASLLHRVLSDKAPHYTIDHVDESLCGIQRTFSVSGTNIYDFLKGEVSEQFNCLFVFNSAKRSISVYDLYTTCLDCGHREDYYDFCPKCGSTKLKYFGEDTTILVDKNNLTDSIHFETNADSIKNCLKLVAGDELMTATIRLLNQNGSDYLYYISEFQMDDMPKELVDKLNQYQKDYDSKTEEYQQAVSNYYETTDRILYLKSGMMPTIEQAEVTAKTEADKLTVENLSPLGISSVTTATSVSTVNSALKNYAKVYAKSGYVKIEIVDGATFEYVGEYTGESALDSYYYGYWTGSFKITNYSDEEDVVTTDKMTIMVYDQYQSFVEQKVLKQLATEDDESSVFDVLAIKDLEDFKNALTHYSLNRLTSFYDAIQGALDVLVQLDQGTEDADFYNVLYEPYFAKLQACQNEIDERQSEIDNTQIQLDSANDLITEIQKELNLRNYLGEDLYNTYCAYRREDTYENSNYISDGLSNTELIDKAKEFLEAANKELKRTAEPQYTITASLKNLLVLKEFKPIVDYFELGNWIRVRVENNLYRLRLIGYDINFGNLQEIGVEFSTITKLRDVAYEAQQITKATKSMASSFKYVAKQAEKGSSAKSSVDNWINNGLNSALVNIKTNDENIVQNDHGILCRYKDEESGEYSPKQLKLLNNSIVFTKDNWKTCSQAIGEHSYKIYDKDKNDWIDATGYGLTSQHVNSAHITGSDLVGNIFYSTNYKMNNPSGDYDIDKYNCDGSFIDMENNCFSFGGKLTWNGTALNIDNVSIKDAINNIEVTPENLRVHAKNIDIDLGKITYDKIDNITVSQIQGTVDSKIQADQIKSINANQIEGDIAAKTAESANTAKNADYATSAWSADIANNVSGIIESSNISSDLKNKNITGTFEGSVKLSHITTDENEITYNTVSGEFTVGDMKLKFVNGLLVSINSEEN